MKRTQIKRMPKNRGRTLRNKCWEIFSEYIRRREADEEGMTACISCGARKHWKELDAGHYVPKSISLILRFNERNVHQQCVSCNRWRHGNLTAYALALQKKYGPSILSELDEIKRQGEGYRISNGEYEQMIENYRRKLGNV